MIKKEYVNRIGSGFGSTKRKGFLVPFNLRMVPFPGRVPCGALPTFAKSQFRKGPPGADDDTAVIFF